jgi:molecular chaperone GrpE
MKENKNMSDKDKKEESSSVKTSEDKPASAPSFAKASEDKQATEDKAPNIEDIKKELEECKVQKDQYLASWQRERADFLNHKKEEMERMGEIIGFAKEELVLGLLPIMDNFDLIEKNLPENLKIDNHVKGILQVKKQFADFLKKLGVEEIKSTDEKFNPQFHEIIEEIEVKDKERGTIVEEIQKGYKIQGRLLRPARVKVVK